MNRGRSKHAQARLHCSVRELGFCGYPSVSVLLLKLGSTIRGDFSALPCCRRFQTSATHDLRTKNSRAGGFDGTHNKFARFPFILIQYDCPHKKTTRSKVYINVCTLEHAHNSHTCVCVCLLSSPPVQNMRVRMDVFLHVYAGVIPHALPA